MLVFSAASSFIFIWNVTLSCFDPQDRLILDLDSVNSLPDNPVQAGARVFYSFPVLFSHVFVSDLMWNW